MIVERVVLFIKPGQVDDFIAALREARQYPAAAEGFGSIRLLRGIEDPDQLIGLLEWESLEAHHRFREGPTFGKWRELIGPHFAAPPEMAHFEEVL